MNFSLITNLFGTVFVQPMYNLLMLIFGLTHSFPVAIVVITLLVRTAMIPLFMKQLTSQRPSSSPWSVFASCFRPMCGSR